MWRNEQKAEREGRRLADAADHVQKQRKDVDFTGLTPVVAQDDGSVIFYSLDRERFARISPVLGSEIKLTKSLRNLRDKSPDQTEFDGKRLRVSVLDGMDERFGELLKVYYYKRRPNVMVVELDDGTVVQKSEYHVDVCDDRHTVEKMRELNEQLARIEAQQSEWAERFLQLRVGCQEDIDAHVEEQSKRLATAKEES